MLSSEAQAAADRMAARFHRMFRWAELEDLKQEARLVAIGAERTWRDGRGASLFSYTSSACAYHLSRYMACSSSPVSGRGGRGSQGVSLEALEHDGDLPLAQRRHVNGQVMLDEQALRRHVSLVVLVELSCELKGMADAHLAIPVLLDEAKPAEVAAEMSVPPLRVYRAVCKAKGRLSRNRALKVLWREVGGYE